MSDEQEAASTREIWAAMMLSPNVEVSTSILNRQPVLVRELDRVALRRALRGGVLPQDDEYITITTEMLYAVHEAGPFAVAEDGVSLRVRSRR